MYIWKNIYVYNYNNGMEFINKSKTSYIYGVYRGYVR